MHIYHFKEVQIDLGRRISFKKVNAAWREQASRFLRNRVEAFLIVFFIGFLMVLDQISANLRMIPSNVLENLSKSNFNF